MAKTTRFGVWLRAALGSRKYGQVAEYVGVSPSTVSRWVTGESAPEYRNVLRLAAYLKIEPAEIEALLPQPASDETPAPSPVYNNQRAILPDWIKDHRLRILFYGYLNDLTQEELDSVLPDIEEAYLRILAERGERDERGDSPGAGPSG